jgi:hypothetical protein
MTHWFQRPKFVEKTPLLVGIFAEYANGGQLWRMWREHSALGQNVWSWIAVQATLWLWLNYDYIIVPGGPRSWAFRVTAFGLILNTAVIVTVIYFRWFA